MYRQFALTISVSTVISSINALTLSPALSAILLRPPSESRFVLFRLFNLGYGATERVYNGALGGLVRRTSIGLLLFVVFVVAAGRGFKSLPTGFLPTEDQGVILISGQLPDAASQERTREVTGRVDEMLGQTPGIAEWVTIGGYSILDGASASNSLTFFVSLKDWDERTDPAQTLEGIVQSLRHQFAGIQDAVVFPIVPPSINGLGMVGGFQMMLQDRGDVGLMALQEMAEEMANAGNGEPTITGVNTTFRANVPQLFIDINRTQAMILGVPLGTIFNTLQAFLGSAYVNDFTFLGKTYQVRVQAESEARTRTENIGRLEVRNRQGDMIPLSTLIDVEETVGPQNLTRYNLYPAASITGGAAPGQSSGQSLLTMERLSRDLLPPSMGFEWTGMSYQERQVGSEAIMIFALAVVLVFLVLAAQYESWTAPLAVVLSVPLALFGVVLATALRGLANDVYMQIGVVLIIGLASKTAILIVEFAREQRAQGKGIREAATEAAKLRFRAILMTAFSSVLGFMPLFIAVGAGAASRRSLGTAVVGGMVSAVLLSVLLVPVFFIVLQTFSEWSGGRHRTERLD
jgi:HAE1 family hydrophobic/amphiphilic exporter-1